MDTNNLMHKVVDTVLVGAGGGGLLNAEQADRFIDYLWDETTLSNEAREIRLRADTRDIDRLSVNTRIAREATEGVDTGENEKPTFTKISVTTSKLRLDWELTRESLEDNIAGDDLEDHVARLMATQFGNDLEDLAINGNTALTDPTLKIFDGFRKRGKDRGTWVQATTPSDGLDKAVFNKALKNMPRKYLARKANLRFYTSAGLIQDFLNSLADRETNLGDAVWFGGPPSGVEGSGGPTGIRPYGVQLVEVPLFSEGFAADGDDPDADPDPSHGYVELMFPNDRIWATKREVTVYREFKPKKDSIEFTVYIRFGVQLDNEEAYVAVYDVEAQD